MTTPVSAVASTTPAAAASAEGTDTLLANTPAAVATGAEADAAAAAAATAAVTAAAEGAKPKEGEKPVGAPEKYEFVAPEGVTLDADLMPDFESFARELNLPQDKAQKLVDMGAKIVQKQQEAVLAMGNQWAETAKTDKEFGGDKLTESMIVAKRTLDTYGTPELRDLLNHSRMGNHPEMIRLFFRVGATLTEDKTTRQSSPAAQAKSAADTLYGAPK